MPEFFFENFGEVGNNLIYAEAAQVLRYTLTNLPNIAL